ncbi:MAG: NERD domain-containing protein [Oscillospiraceae bacterium]|nr:NERD domain-containing protein [Oscillospiraceae bacterium]
MGLGSLLRFLVGAETPNDIGRKGENKIARKLAWSNTFGKPGITLNNVYVPRKDGRSSEIDLLYITRKGIIVIESKNYSGFIFGDENNKNWTATLYAGKDWIGRKQIEKHQFYNPIWQNRTHINSLRRYLVDEIPMFSLIVFSDRCEIKELRWSDPNVYICHTDGTNGMVSKIWKHNPDVLNDAEVMDIAKRLMPFANLSEEEKQQHVADLRARYQNTVICPWCGRQLVLRTARQTGRQFYGCAGYPSCKYTKNI